MFPVAQWLFRGKVLLGYAEKEVWKMTIRQLAALFDEYCVWNNIGVSKRTEEDNENLFPDAI